jgi:hypothetical protein
MGSQPLLFIQVDIPFYLPLREYVLESSSISLPHAHSKCAIDFAAIGGPNPQTFDLLHHRVAIDCLFYLLYDLRVGAAVEEENERLLDDGHGGVDGQEGEEVGAERVGNLPVGPDVAVGREEVDDAGQDDDSDGQDDVGEDVDVGCFHVDVVVEVCRTGNHFLVRSKAGQADFIV